MPLEIIDRPSPNHSARPSGVTVDAIVIHGTAGKTDEGDLSWITSEKSGISYHYMVGRTGKVYRLVRPERRAWHAGKSILEGDKDINDRSIGVAFSNNGAGEPYTDAQYEAAGALLAVLARTWKIEMAHIVGHNYVSGKWTKVRDDPKTDPWDWMNWGRLFADILKARG